MLHVLGHQARTTLILTVLKNVGKGYISSTGIDDKSHGCSVIQKKVVLKVSLPAEIHWAHRTLLPHECLP